MHTIVGHNIEIEHDIAAVVVRLKSVANTQSVTICRNKRWNLITGFKSRC